MRSKSTSAEEMTKEKLRDQGELGSCSTPVSKIGSSEGLAVLSDNLEVISCDQVNYNVGGEGTFEEYPSQSEEEEMYSRSQVDVVTVL